MSAVVARSQPWQWSSRFGRRSVAILALMVAIGLPSCAPRYRPLPDAPPVEPSTAESTAADAPVNDASVTVAPAQPQRRGQARNTPDTLAAWPFWPAFMRLHPLTRLTEDRATGVQIIECRIEFEDPDQQTCRAVGQLTIQLYPDATAPTGAGAALQTWNQDLRDLELNRRQYDDVTRTYLFRLQLTQPPPPGAELRAFFLSADGKRMNGEIRLRQ
jgi:hypothetical protein